MPTCYVISGCSGGGKSTLLDALAKRGVAFVKEPGRRIVRQELDKGGQALPWIDPVAFAHRAMAMARDDWQKIQSSGPAQAPIFFDRSAIDAVSFLKSLLPDTDMQAELGPVRYHKTVFMAPPWPELFSQDAERQHGFAEARGEFERLMLDYPALGYEVVMLEKVSVCQRLDFILEWIDRSNG